MVFARLLGILSAGLYQLPPGESALGAQSGRLSLGQSVVARGRRGIGLAGAPTFEDAGRVAGRRSVRAPSGQRGISGLDFRAQEHAGDVLLPAESAVLLAVQSRV